MHFIRYSAAIKTRDLDPQLWQNAALYKYNGWTNHLLYLLVLMLLMVLCI